MDLLTFFATHRGCHAHLCAESRTDRLPAIVNAFVLETEPDLMHQVIGQQGDKDVTLDPMGFLMVNGTHSQF